jgi:hypothetical protein
MISCLTYTPCGSLLIPVANTVVDRPDESFVETCSIESVLTENGYKDCQDKCAEATCCTAEGDENCFQVDPVGCLQHLQCGLLALAGGSVEAADTEKLTQTCDLQEILNNGPSDECKQACQAAECCVSQQDNCLADGNVLACASYLPCLPVLVLDENGIGDIFSGGGLSDLGDGFPDFSLPGSVGEGSGDGVPPLFGEGTIGEPPEDLQEKCSNSDTLDECKELCEEVECCTSMGEDNCLVENVIACATWNLQGCFAVNGFQKAP